MNKRYYKSNYGGGDITALQYITELVIAKFAGCDLPDKFWELNKYKKLWGKHAKDVAILLKQYSPEVISAGLKDSRLRKLRSVHPKAAFMWKSIFDYYTKILSRIKTTEIKDGISGINRKPFKPKNSRSNI